MELKFTKMQGAGNDFILVDVRNEDPGNWSELAVRLAHRRFGVGCDQLLLLKNSDRADYRMEILNSDGSEVEMCGNGIRCFARYLRSRNLCDKEEIAVETLAGIQLCRFEGEMVVVDMGVPEFEGSKIPTKATGFVREEPLKLDDGNVLITCVSMGNPHAVIFVDEVESYPIGVVGPKVENHPFFPRRTNVEFIQVLGRNKLRMRVWERGAGITMACGTGACASAVAAYWTGRGERETEVVLDGGSLFIRWDGETEHVFLTGPGVEVFTGCFTL